MKLKDPYDDVSKTVAFIPAVTQHSFTQRIEEFLRYWKIPVADHKKIEEDSVLYQFIAKPGFSVLFQIYKDERHEVFFRLEVGLASIQPQLINEIAKYLLQKNYEHHFPFWFSITTDNVLILECRSYCDGFTENGFTLRLNTIVDFSSSTFHELKERFGILPLVPE
ncbi:MAG: hypothetical protein AB7F43_07695 [Bacteriovoracia bacterium]